MNTLEVYDKQVKEATEAVRQYAASLLAENEELARELEKARAELTEARKQPVALLPELNDAITKAMELEWYTEEYTCAEGERGRAANTVLARHFREAVEARVKPEVDVGAVIDDLWRELYGYYVTKPQFLCQIEEVIRRHVSDAPAPPLQESQQLDEAKLRREIAQYLRQNGERIETGELAVLEAAHEIERGSATPTDEILAAAVKRVERETRRECAAMVREWGQTPFAPYESLADRMERGE